MKKIVLLVEGEGDVKAAPILLERLLKQQKAWDVATPDRSPPLRVGGINRLAKTGYREWKRKLVSAMKRPNVGGILLLLDGDAKKLNGEDFCAAKAARELAAVARSEGGGVNYSVAVVFARQEFESWLIAGFESLAGKSLPNGRVIAANSTAPDGNLEENPRDAKGWLNRVIEGGYKPTRDQATLTKMVDLDAIRNRQPRSFRRLESAVSELIAAIRDDAHVVTPS